ncbi:DUF397 domain-containing protein [Streptomyces scabiei]
MERQGHPHGPQAAGGVHVRGSKNPTGPALPAAWAAFIAAGQPGA